MSRSDRRTAPRPVFVVEVRANPEVPGSEADAEAARRVVDEALTAAGWPDHPPRRLRLVRDEGRCG